MVKGHIASISCSIDSKLHDLHCECYSIVEKKNKQKSIRSLDKMYCKKWCDVLVAY